ncbi:MgtC family protein [Burkholderia sp. OK233]|nr:MgtC family protein [Burkholderia sp. OK233]
MLGNLELISRLVLAAALGSVIGFERERLSWAAGLRTHMTMIVERGIMTFHSLHDELGAASPRVKQFVMQQSDDAPECDEVIIALHRVSNTEYEAICSRLRQLRGVKQFRQDEASS